MLATKPSILFASVFVLSSPSIYAAIPVSNTNSLVVTIPAFRPGFEFSIAALALKAGADNLNYVIFNQELPVQSPSWTEKEIKPSYDAAFGLDVRYIFSEGEDVKLDWVHLNSSSSANVVAPNDQFFLGPDYEIGPDALDIRKAVGRAQFKYDVVNLDFGQFVNFGDHVQIRFFGGLSNVYLREQVSSTYSGNVLTGPFPGPFSTNQKVKSDFTGLGPRIGMNASYNTASGFGLLGEGAISALMGSLYTKTSFTSASAELEADFDQTINNQFIKDRTGVQVVPGLDAKLAGTYKHLFTNCLFLTLTAGYQAAVYINAINQYLPASLVAFESIDTGGIFVATMNHTQSNYSVHGPYIEVALEI